MNIFRKNDDIRTLVQAFAGALAVAVLAMFGGQAYATAVTLSVTVATSLTFTITTNQFGTQTPGTAQMATSTLSATTNDSNGWLVTLSGDNKTTSNNNLETAANAANISDQTEWVNGAATTSAGTAVQISSFTNSGNVLAFRVMASSTNGVSFTASTWWGNADNYLATNANTLYAGIASSTVARQIGNAGAGSYSASAHLNSVNYYLNVASTQSTGTYTAPITYTATGN